MTALPDEWVRHIRLADDRYRDAKRRAASAAKTRAVLIARLHRMGHGYGSIAQALDITKSRAQQLVERGERHIKDWQG